MTQVLSELRFCISEEEIVVSTSQSWGLNKIIYISATDQLSCRCLIKTWDNSVFLGNLVTSCNFFLNVSKDILRASCYMETACDY